MADGYAQSSSSSVSSADAKSDLSAEHEPNAMEGYVHNAKRVKLEAEEQHSMLQIEQHVAPLTLSEQKKIER